ncbi:hypothetical protein ABZT45_46920 [Streptomyces sp. NPDC005356]|uniref:hypothetical protein n=1 Tax=unclassified Streptomyces TaxID=2593676 RepID=UPI0033A943D7
MQGRDLALATRTCGQQGWDGALFGIHGGHVNVTDGRHVYMRGAVDVSNAPLEEYTLMPTHMRSRFAVRELTEWEPAEPLSCTKGIRTMRMPATPTWMNPWQHGTLLFDLDNDPAQEHPLRDDETELRMLQLLARRMRESDAPRSQFERLGIPFDGEPTQEHLLVAAREERARALAEPLTGLDELPARELLDLSVHELVQVDGARAVLEEHAPGLVSTELDAVPGRATLIDLASYALITSEQLRALASALTRVPTG